MGVILFHDLDGESPRKGDVRSEEEMEDTCFDIDIQRATGGVCTDFMQTSKFSNWWS
jgi:hypothetical protein